MATKSPPDRVSLNIANRVNRRIEARTDRAIEHYARNPDAIERRLKELEREWDIERWLETNASILMLVGLGLTTFVSRRWLALPAIVGGFLLQPGIQGWCPPVPVFRRLGVRTRQEIMREYYTLRAPRGDLHFVNPLKSHVPRLAPGQGAEEPSAAI